MLSLLLLFGIRVWTSTFMMDSTRMNFTLICLRPWSTCFDSLTLQYRPHVHQRTVSRAMKRFLFHNRLWTVSILPLSFRASRTLMLRYCLPTEILNSASFADILSANVRAYVVSSDGPNLREPVNWWTFANSRYLTSGCHASPCRHHLFVETMSNAVCFSLSRKQFSTKDL